uniref:Uncharacterized protein n=1 Tax=Parascaris univalens TaxID=6257 RepID=A0A915A812_PARUN
MNILYNRRQKLIDGIMRVKNAAFYYPIASNAPEFKLKQGSVVVLARRGWLCSLRVTTDGRLQVLLERLARTFPCHPAGCTVRSEKEQLFLMSATGEETIVIFSGKKQLKYHIYYTHPSVQ